ncbi:MAG: hypothetical protein AB4040_02310 [Synechococcus sp.]
MPDRRDLRISGIKGKLNEILGSLNAAIAVQIPNPPMDVDE